MASESLRGKERKHHSCEFLSGLQASPWRPQIFGLVEAHRIAQLAMQCRRDQTAPDGQRFKARRPCAPELAHPGQRATGLRSESATFISLVPTNPRRVFGTRFGIRCGTRLLRLFKYLAVPGSLVMLLI